MIETYQYKKRSPLKCPISVFYGTEDPYVIEENSKQWAQHTESNFSFNKYNGDHFFIFHHEKQILHSIQSILDNESHLR
jgi:surfactin synthase thioesterase subunit